MVRLGPILPAYGLARPDFSLLVLDFIHLDLVMSLQALIRMGLFLLAYGIACMGLPPLILDFAVLESVTFIQGLC
jgi:hypothetical protein